MTDDRTSSTSNDLERELATLRRERSELEELIGRLTFERDGYYGEWRHAKQALEAVRRSPAWPVWLLWRLLRKTLLLLLGAVLAIPAAILWLLLVGAPRLAARVWLVGWTWIARLQASRRPAAGNIPEPLPISRPTDPSQRPRVLIVSPYSIYPPHHGGAVRLYNLVRRLADRCRIHLLIFCQEGEDPVQRAALEPLCSRVDFHRWRPDLTPDRLHLMPPSALIFRSDIAASKIRDLVIGHHIDIVQLEYTELGQYVSAVPDGVPVILTEHDIAFRSFERRRRLGFQHRFPEGSAYGTSRHDWRRLFRYEIDCDRSVTQIHTMSEDDGRYLSRYLSDAAGRIRVAPNGVDTEWYAPPADAGVRRDVLYVGNFENLPNVDALEHFVADVWPLIRLHRPDARLSVVGANASDRVRRFDGSDGITVVGEVADLRPSYHGHRVMVAPIRAGSGTRLKILEAFAAGLPVVSTELGAEGIGYTPGTHLLVADAAVEFAAAVEQVLADDDLAETLAREGLALVRERYDWSRVADRIQACYEELLADVHPLRRSSPQEVLEVLEPKGGTPPVDPEVSVLIPTRNGGEELVRCLSAINAQRGAPPAELICIDSGSPFEDIEGMRRSGARVLRIDGSRFNHGLTRDLAAHHATGSVLVYLNQDAVPEDDRWLAHIVEPLLEKDTSSAAVQGGIREVPDVGRRFFWESCGDRFYFTRETARWLKAYDNIGFSTVNCAIRRSAWERNHFGWAPIMEDKKWQRDVVDMGGEIVSRPDAAVLHTHDYDLRSLVRRCSSEGYGWRSLGIRYSLWDAIRDMLKPRMFLTLVGGLVRGRVRTLAELSFPWLRPLALWWGNRFAGDVTL